MSDTQATSTVATVAALFVYPLKSAAAIAVDTMTLDARGAEGDRRWMLVGANGTSITAREQHRLVLIQPAFAGADRNGALRLAAPHMPLFTVKVPHGAAPRRVRIWADEVDAQDAGDEAAEWCSDVLGAHARLVYLADTAARPLQPKYAGALPWADREVALSDGAPLLLLGQASVDALNARLLAQGEHALTFARFRPNILLAGAPAHAEDTWSEITIGAVTIGVGTPCLRCVLTTVDPVTADAGTEPLRTLADYRRDAGGVVFGMNATHAAVGAVQVGDEVRVTALR